MDNKTPMLESMLLMSAHVAWMLLRWHYLLVPRFFDILSFEVFVLYVMLRKMLIFRCVLKWFEIVQLVGCDVRHWSALSPLFDSFWF